MCYELLSNYTIKIEITKLQKSRKFHRNTIKIEIENCTRVAYTQMLVKYDES